MDINVNLTKNIQINSIYKLNVIILSTFMSISIHQVVPFHK